MNDEILVVDDEPDIRSLISLTLEDEGFLTIQAANAQDARSIIASRPPSCVILDIWMRDSDMDGIDILKWVQELYPEVPVLMISGHGNIETAVQALKFGAHDFIEKPFKTERLLLTVKRALQQRRLARENAELRASSGRTSPQRLIGQSSVMKQLQQAIERVAPTDARVLIIGANGSGKELIAHAIHQKSERSNAPMIEVNCAAIPSELIESELFGHEKGAFTSAIKQRKGKFETANGGTLFLDEVGDMSLKAQAKVLRALQEHKISRVGSDREIKVNVRVLAATNKDLQHEIKEGRFREDLYHRLGVILINNPSLDERKDDIPILIEHFNSEICKEHGIAKKSFTDDALKVLMAYNWSGNIRELRNVIERLIILSSDTIDKETVKSFSGK